MSIHLIKLYFIFSDIGYWFPWFQILFKCLESLCISSIRFKIHVFSHYHILSYFSFDFIQIPIIKNPMLREKNLVRQVDRFNIGIFFVKRCRYAWINCIVGWKIESIIDILFDVYTIILSCIFFTNLHKFDHSHVTPFLDLTEKTVIKSRSSI